MSRSHRRSKWSNTWLQLLIQGINILLLVLLIVWIEYGFTAISRSDKKQSLQQFDKIDTSTRLSILRLLQALLSALTTFSLQECFQLLQWSFISRSGLSFSDLLSISPTTGSLGLMNIIIASNSKASSKLWALLRGVLLVVTWVASLVLFFNTSIVNIFDTSTTYNATAGMGAFNGSYVEPFISYINSKHPTFPYSYYGPIYNLVNNPAWSVSAEPIYCRGSECYSYLLNGGVMMSTPWLPLGHDDFPLARLANIPSIQMEFYEQPLSFIDTDCETFGQSDVPIAARLCLTEPSEGRINAGIFVCQNGSDGDKCRTTNSSQTYFPNITTSVQFFGRQATVTAARSNFSITGVQSMGPYTSVEVDLLAYKAALNWLLNFTAAGIPAPSSMVELFWTDRNAMRDPAHYAILSQSFQSILAFPFWFFNANNYGNLALQAETIITSLPPEFYTQVDIVRPYSMLDIDRSMYGLFLALQGIAMLFCIVILFWVWLRAGALPTISSFPLFDAIVKAKSTFIPELGDMDQADDGDILAALSNRKAELKLAVTGPQSVQSETVTGLHSQSQADAGGIRRVVAIRRGTL